MQSIISYSDHDPRIAKEELHAFTRSIWEHAGSCGAEAGMVADHLVAANLAGHDSHGVGMIPRYLRSLRSGGLRLNTHAYITRDSGALLTVDGCRGFGQVVAREAMEYGIERAKKLGICAVALRNAHHVGRIGHWAEQCAEHGLASFHFVNVAGDPLVAPYGGIDPRIGTNPFCAAYPRKGKPPLLLDFATSRIAYGKTRVAYNKGLHLPAGCLLDHDGRPSTDPAVMHRPPFGALLPFGEYKGYGLAAMCEVFAGAMSGGFTTHADTLVKGDAIINCMLSVLIDPASLDAADAEAEADAFLQWIRESRRMPDTEQIYLPGEMEHCFRCERTAAGIPLDSATWRQLVEAAQMVGVEPPPLLNAGDIRD